MDPRQAQFGPETSWPNGYPAMDYRDGGYRRPAPREALPPSSQGEHPYAAFSAAGYGDDGYRDPGYDGPAAQDAGIAGTRTVRGFVEPGLARSRHGLPAVSQPGYPEPGHPEPGYPEPGHAQAGQGGSGFGSGQVELSYPMPLSAEVYPAADTHRQPGDYGQPLRGYEPGDRRAQAYDSARYNGSEYSMPGVNGPGYDLSGILGTGDFEASGYDEPSYDRLSYDDPRYDDTPGYGGAGYDLPRAGAPRDYGQRGLRSDETRFDETRLDSLWLGEDEIRRGNPVGYGNDGFGTDTPVRSGYAAFSQASGGRLDETRLDLGVGDLRMDQTRFDVPVFDQTRVDGMRALAPTATGLLAPPEDRPLSWAAETSLDAFGDLNLDEELARVPAAFARTAVREDSTATRRGIGRRRGRSGDRRQWMALGAIAVVAAGAIGGVLMKYVFSGPSGPAHTVVAPNQVDAFTRMPNLEKQMKVDALRESVMQTSQGQATDVVSAVYQQGSSAPGSNPQIFMFVGGELSSASPGTSLASFEQHYPGAQVVPAGTLGGDAACAEARSGGEGVAMCVWFDNDSFGELVSPTMTTAKLATTLDDVRPSLELYAR